MGLARIAIAVLAVVVAFGLLVIGGIALWGALTGKDDKDKPGAVASAPADATKASSGKASSGKASSPASGNTIEVKCLAVTCAVFVAGPDATNVQFSGNLKQGEIRTFNETRLTMSVDDASTVDVTINGRPQARGPRGEKTYEAPSSH